MVCYFFWQNLPLFEQSLAQIAVGRAVRGTRYLASIPFAGLNIPIEFHSQN